MDDQDRKLSADESVGPAPQSAADEQSHTPHSPRPRLFDNDIQASSPQASDVLSDEDYRKLRTVTFTSGMVPALLTAGAASYFAPAIARRLRPPGPPNPGILRTGAFIVSFGAALSFHTYTTLSDSVSRARTEARHQALPKTEDGGVILTDSSVSGDMSPVDQASLALAASATGILGQPPSPQSAMSVELERLGKSKERTRWSKGRGLDGEVEEEAEMRDTWFRPGTPRREV